MGAITPSNDKWDATLASRLGLSVMAISWFGNVKRCDLHMQYSSHRRPTGRSGGIRASLCTMRSFGVDPVLV